MKQLGKDILISLFMGLVVPGMVLNIASAVWEREAEPEAAVSVPPASETAEVSPVALPVKFRGNDGRAEEMDMDAYLVGVVLAEMPASFEEEALKAQSVVARTYARKAWVTGGKHGDGSVCGNSACCQAYLTDEEYLQKGGSQESVEKIRGAVLATSGQVLTYEGQLIEATYFSCSGGSTEDAAAVWGTDFPYLQAVDSPGEEGAAHYRDTVVFTPEEVEAALDVTLTGDPSGWIGAISFTEGGGVASVVIGGNAFEGTQLRTLLGLRSTAFTITAEADAITIITSGYGHRVGMSQYGADAMAVTGSTYEEILTYYYQGAELTQLEGE